MTTEVTAMCMQCGDSFDWLSPTGPRASSMAGDEYCCQKCGGHIQVSFAPTDRQFRKKPVVIDAMEFRGEDARARAYEIKAWTYGCTPSTSLVLHTSFDGSVTLKIPTPEGTMHAGVGDWIIRGVKGEFYPCKPEIFEATYERVTAPTPPYCPACAKGSPVSMLDEDGTRTDISKRPGVPSHASGDCWWPCPYWQRVAVTMPVVDALSGDAAAPVTEE